MKAHVSCAYWLCGSLGLVTCEQGVQPCHIEEKLTKDSIPVFDSTAIKRFDSLLQAEQQRMAAKPFVPRTSPDTIKLVLPEYSITNATFSALLDSISQAMRTCPDHTYGRIGAQRSSRGVAVEITMEDRNTIGPKTIGYLDQAGRTFALLGIENLHWLLRTGKSRAFQYVDHHEPPATYDPPAWWILVRGDSIYRGTGSSFPCE